MTKHLHEPISANARRLKTFVIVAILFAVVHASWSSAQEPLKVVRGSLDLHALSPVGRASPTENLILEFGLPLENREALGLLIEQLYDPDSPNFHQYLTTDAFTEAFRPTTNDYQAVIEFAVGNGLTLVKTKADRSLLYVTGTVADVERIFRVKMQLYQHPSEQRIFMAPDVEPSVPADLKIQTVWGLTVLLDHAHTLFYLQ